jgi:flagellar biosynthesis anti-sigma factor FlgM
MINSISSSQGTPEAADQTGNVASPRPQASAPVTEGGAATSSEAVTLSADTVATTQLLDAARSADGVDQTAVEQLRAAVQSGSYDVSPDDLARAITGAFKEISS